METSDSEYFESADEDLESEDEITEKQEKSNGASTCNQVLEPEMCKLKIEEQHSKGRNETDIENVRSPPNEPPRPEQVDEAKTVLENKVEKPLVPVVHLETHISREKPSLLPVSKDSESKVSPLAEKQEEEQSNLWDDDDKPLVPIVNTGLEPLVPESKDAKNPVEKPSLLPVAKDSESKVLPAAAKQEEEQSNLWDDDELDWGSEATKEQSDITKQSTPIDQLKTEDSGWDDFDADWESENLTKEKKTTVVSSSKQFSQETQSIVSTPSWDEEWEPVEKPDDKTDFGWSGWGGWGVTSLLSSASQSVSTLTSQVSSAIESTMGIPQPEALAKIDKKEDADKLHSPTTHHMPGPFGLGNIMSGVTKFVETTGTKVIAGGLDTLEAIGKKTVEVLQEGDPGLRKKRAFLKLEPIGKPNLSQILREAKEKAEEESQEDMQKHTERRRVKNYETLFDDHQGLVHLEALEMLSKLCTIKLDNLNNSLSGDALKDMQETLEQVNELCELTDEDEEDKVDIDQTREIISNAVKEINIPLNYDKLFKVCKEANSWLETMVPSLIDDIELHQQALNSLAEITALAVEQFHKAGELLLVKEHRSTADEADSLVQITIAVKALILHEAEKFTEKMNSLSATTDKDKINEHITNIFFEAGNSGTYIQDAFQLLIPVIQVGAV